MVTPAQYFKSAYEAEKAGKFNSAVSSKTTARKSYYLERNEKGEIVGATEKEYAEQKAREEQNKQQQKATPSVGQTATNRVKAEGDGDYYGAESVTAKTYAPGVSGVSQKLIYEQYKASGDTSPTRNVIEARGKVGRVVFPAVANFFVGTIAGAKEWGKAVISSFKGENPADTTKGTIAAKGEGAKQLGTMVLEDLKQRPLGVAVELGTGAVLGAGVSGTVQKAKQIVKPATILVEEDALQLGIRTGEITQTGTISDLRVTVNKKPIMGVAEAGGYSITEGATTDTLTSTKIKLLSPSGEIQKEIKLLSVGEFGTTGDKTIGSVRVWEVPKTYDYTTKTKYLGELGTETTGIDSGITKTTIQGSTKGSKIDIVGFRFAQEMPEYNRPELGLTVTRSAGATAQMPGAALITNDLSGFKPTKVGKTPNVLSGGGGTETVAKTVTQQATAEVGIRAITREIQTQQIVKGVVAGGEAGFGVTVGGTTITKQKPVPATTSVTAKLKTETVTGPVLDFGNMQRSGTITRPLQMQRIEVAQGTKQATIPKTDTLTPQDTRTSQKSVYGRPGYFGNVPAMPVMIPMPNFGGGYQEELFPQRKGRVGKLQGGYFPSLRAVLFDIKSPTIPKVITGLNMRPIKL